MKFARMKYKYLYEMQKHPHDWDRWPRDGNIGDCIQNLAIENLYKEMGISNNDLLKVNRDEIPDYTGEECILPMQAWFGNYAGTFPLPWSKNIIPVFLGFHVNKGWETRDRFIDENIHDKMKKYQPIGCRDRNTKDFLLSLGVDAYFSGCMTLTFPKREYEPDNGKIFLVDLTEKAKQIVPEEIKNAADESITHFYYFKEYPVSEKGALEFEDEARKILNRYKNEAKLVITSKIHSAMPCIAMGIPVIFINENIDDERFDVLKGILPLYTPDRSEEINWNPSAINIDSLKNAIKENAFFRIWKIAKQYNLQVNKTFDESDETTILQNLKEATTFQDIQLQPPTSEETQPTKDESVNTKKKPFLKLFINLLPVRKWRKKLRTKLL